MIHRELAIFEIFKTHTLDVARQNGWKGICLGCCCPIRGKFAPAIWSGSLRRDDDESHAGTLFACHCPGCGIELLAWEAGIWDVMDGAELYWNMRAVETHYGFPIKEDQVITWSECSTVVE